MKIISHSLVIVLIFSNAFLLGQTPEKIPLERAIEEGLKKDFEYLNSVLDQEKVEIQRQLAARKKLFRLDFNGSYIYRSETMKIDFFSGQIPGFSPISSQPVEIGLMNNFDFNISLTQPLFTGGILSNSIKLEDVRKAEAANQEILKKNEFSGLIKSSFFQYLLLTRRRQSLITLEKTLDLHRRRLEDLLGEGLARKTDFLETLSKIEEILLSINDIEQAMELETIHFIKLCGYSPEEIDPSYSEKSLSQTEALSYFQQYHPMLKTLHNQAEILNLQKKITSGRRLPQVSGFAEVHYGKPGIDLYKKEWTLYFQGGIVLSLPVFDWNRLGSEKTLLDYQIQKLENQEGQFVKDITKRLEQLFTSLRKLEEKKAHIDQLVLYSGEDAELKAALFKEKQMPNVDYLSALLAREKNVLMREEIQIQIEMIRVNINAMIGNSKEGGDV
jgi:outer membrane protein TolC